MAQQSLGKMANLNHFEAEATAGPNSLLLALKDRVRMRTQSFCMDRFDTAGSSYLTTPPCKRDGDPLSFPGTPQKRRHSAVNSVEASVKAVLNTTSRAATLNSAFSRVLTRSQQISGEFARCWQNSSYLSHLFASKPACVSDSLAGTHATIDRSYSPEDSGYDSSSQRSYTDPSTPMSCESGDFSSTISAGIHSSDSSIFVSNPPLIASDNFTCLWYGCGIRFDAITKDQGFNLAEHIRECHIEPQRAKAKFACLWVGCRVYGQESNRISWLESHVTEKHCGPKPYKCLLETCGSRFWTKVSAERHINSHFSKKRLFSDISSCSSSASSTPTTLRRERSPDCVHAAPQTFDRKQPAVSSDAHRRTASNAEERKGQGERSAEATCASNDCAARNLDLLSSRPAVPNTRHESSARSRAKPSECGFNDVVCKNREMHAVASSMVNALKIEMSQAIEPPATKSIAIEAQADGKIRKRNLRCFPYTSNRKYGRLLVPALNHSSSLANESSGLSDCAAAVARRTVAFSAQKNGVIGARAIRLKHSCTVINKSHDFVDARCSELMHERLIPPARSSTGCSNGGLSVEVHGEIQAVRCDRAGNVFYFVQWLPQGIFVSEWISRELYQEHLCIPLRQLTSSCSANLTKEQRS